MLITLSANYRSYQYLIFLSVNIGYYESECNIVTPDTRTDSQRIEKLESDMNQVLLNQMHQRRILVELQGLIEEIRNNTLPWPFTTGNPPTDSPNLGAQQSTQLFDTTTSGNNN